MLSVFPPGGRGLAHILAYFGIMSGNEEFPNGLEYIDGGEFKSAPPVEPVV